MGRFKKAELERLYLEMMGAEADQRQREAAARARGGCACRVRVIKKRWDGTSMSERKIHEPHCPKWRWWMSELDSLSSSD